MKSTLLLIAVLTCSIPFAKAQKKDSTTIAHQKQYDYYWDKRNARNRTGWVLLSTGMFSFGIVALQNASAGGDFDYLPSSIYGFAIAGIATTLTSIPFFIAARDNKRKARLALKGEAVSFGTKPVTQNGYTALSLTFPL